MLFNSIQFFLFFIIVYGLYLAFKHRWQNWLLIVASCLFYAAWNWKFLLLMFVSISTDFWCSNLIVRTSDLKKRRAWLWLSLGVNLGILGFFKYYNFFAGNVQGFLQTFHLVSPAFSLALNIVLPVGVSFYTFEAISYIVDVYHEKIKPAQRYWDYVLFVIYFPHLIAGPIMRAKDFLPQISLPRKIRLDQFYDGCFLFFWGLLEKILIADNLAKIADPIFSAVAPYDGGKVLIALYAFAFQIFCDFDGYSNMARGMGKCMGFEITINFKQPYFSTNPQEFWQRWHISLSSWLRDYLYIPLGGNRKGKARTYINLFLTMLLGGLWHGAAWTFVLWGAYQGVLLAIHRVVSPYFSNLGDNLSEFLKGLWKLARIIFFFQFICLGWLLFRATSLSQVGEMLTALFNPVSWHFQSDSFNLWMMIITYISITVFVQFFQYQTNDQTAALKWPWQARAAFYILCYFLVIFYGVEGGKQFIYFQF
ncbi:MAG: MBOAT family protein [Candidatus Omnitrophica bacterium]|nr:MBOAT family protein [Candidatus Omnitrophota bacterium]